MFAARSLLSMVLLCCFTAAFAQRPAAMVRKGEQAVQVQDYYTAIHYFRQALERKPVPDVRFRLAEAALAFKAYELAVEQYTLLLDGPAAAQYATAYLGLAQAQQAMGEYTAALASLDELEASARASKQQLAQAREVRESCQWAQTYASEEEWDIGRLPRRINSPYGEFAPWKSGDTLYFTSYRYDKKDDNYTPARKVSKVMISKDERSGRPISRGFNQDTVLTAHTAISPAGDQLFFSRCQFVAGAAIDCKLCLRTKDRRGKWAKKYQVLPAPVNMANCSTTQPALRWDSVGQQLYLLFASNRPGGKGGFDLWEVPVPENLKKWETPQALTALNTRAAEMTPFFSVTHQRLYFSTDRAPSFGGFDLGQAAYLGDGQWGAYENLGPALNSSYDENYPFFVNEDRAYFSSNRPGGRYLDDETKTCCPDLFTAQRVLPAVELPPDTVPATEIAVTPPSPPAEKPAPRTLEEFLPLTLYYDNDQPDPRTRRSSTQQSYKDTYFDYLRREDKYYEQFDDNAEQQDALAQFFEEEVSKGFRDLDRFSDILLEQLVAGQSVEIFLKGYTSPRAQGDYNLLLGKRRVSAVRNHFANWQAGVFQVYIESGQLVISEVSFGETQASSSAQDEKAGERLSIYSPEAARERRVEIVEIKRL